MEKRAKNPAKASKTPRIDSFTKVIVLVLLINAIAWVWCSYGLAYLGRYEIAESLSATAIDVILGVFIAYAVKSGVENVNKYGVNLRPTKKSGANTKYRDY